MASRKPPLAILRYVHASPWVGRHDPWRLRAGGFCARGSGISDDDGARGANLTALYRSASVAGATHHAPRRSDHPRYGGARNVYPSTMAYAVHRNEASCWLNRDTACVDDFNTNPIQQYCPWR